MRNLRQTLARRAALAVANLAPGLGEGRLSRPYFVVTAGRSGSTFLMRVLEEHPDLAVYPSEANRLWHPKAYPRRRFGEEVPRFWREPERFVEYSLRHQTAADARRLRATFGAYRALMGRPTFVCKSAMIQFSLPWVCGQFPDARFIHLVRDGRSVVLSYGKRLLRRGKEESPDPAPDGEMLRALARYWRDSVDAVDRASRELGLAAEGRLLEVSYEALCADPAAELRRLTAFFGLAAPATAGRLPAGFEDRNWKAARELTGELAADLDAIMRPGLERLGYA